MYDFDAAPKCAFWNTSYGVLARSVGLSVRDFKEQVRRRKASPIVYADSFPIGVKNSVANKHRLRAVVDGEAIDAHIDRIFSFEPVLRRVKVVLASGLDREVFRRAVQRTRNKCAMADIIFAEVPFFHGMFVPRIKFAIQGALDAEITRIVKQFMGEGAE